jgi:hypothetical protein
MNFGAARLVIDFIGVKIDLSLTGWPIIALAVPYPAPLWFDTIINS